MKARKRKNAFSRYCKRAETKAKRWRGMARADWAARLVNPMIQLWANEMRGRIAQVQRDMTVQLFNIQAGPR